MRSAGSRRMTTATSMARARPAEARRAVPLMLDHVQVDVGREPPVEAHLLATEVPPARERGEIEEAEVHRLLDLVHALAGEEHPGDVCLDELHPIHGVRVDGGVEEPGDEDVDHSIESYTPAARRRRAGPRRRPCAVSPGAGERIGPALALEHLSAVLIDDADAELADGLVRLQGQHLDLRGEGVAEIGRGEVLQRLAHEDGPRARQVHGHERIQHARGDAALRDEPAEAGARREVGIEVQRVAIARDLGVELHVAREDGLGPLCALPHAQAERAERLSRARIALEGHRPHLAGSTAVR